MILLQVNFRIIINPRWNLIDPLCSIPVIVTVIFQLDDGSVQVFLKHRFNVYYLLKSVSKVFIFWSLLARNRFVFKYKKQRVVHYSMLSQKQRILLQYMSKLILLNTREVDQAVI